MHYIRICTKKGHKARWREGDKCFFIGFFISRGLCIDVIPASMDKKANAFEATPAFDFAPEERTKTIEFICVYLCCVPEMDEEKWAKGNDGQNGSQDA